MRACSSCKKELRDSEEFGLIRFQLWKTKVGSGECRGPDLDETQSYCVPCARSIQVSLWRD